MGELERDVVLTLKTRDTGSGEFNIKISVPVEIPQLV